MIGHLFYTFGLFLFFLTLTKTLSYFKLMDVREWVIKFKEKVKRIPVKSDYRSLQDYNMLLTFGLVIVLETIWFIVGLLTSNWKIFGMVIIVNALSKILIVKLPFPVQKVLGLVLSFTRCVLILILVINHFHLHYDLLNLI